MLSSLDTIRGLVRLSSIVGTQAQGFDRCVSPGNHYQSVLFGPCENKVPRYCADLTSYDRFRKQRKREPSKRRESDHRPQASAASADAAEHSAPFGYCQLEEHGRR
jgi:hypothetical protein